MSIARNLFVGREPLKFVGRRLRHHGPEADARGERPGDRRCRAASPLARRHGRRAVRRPAPGRRHRPGHAFQVEDPRPRRADQPSLGQGDQQGARLHPRASRRRTSPASSSATTCTTSSSPATASSPWRAARSSSTSRSARPRSRRCRSCFERSPSARSPDQPGPGFRRTPGTLIAISSRSPLLRTERKARRHLGRLLARAEQNSAPRRGHPALPHIGP